MLTKADEPEKEKRICDLLIFISYAINGKI